MNTTKKATKKMTVKSKKTAKKSVKGTRRVVQTASKMAAVATKGIVPFALPNISNPALQEILASLGACWSARQSLLGTIPELYKKTNYSYWRWFLNRISANYYLTQPLTPKQLRMFGGRKRAKLALKAADDASQAYAQRVGLGRYSHTKYEQIKVEVFRKFYTVKKKKQQRSRRKHGNECWP